jgi:V/A-type H+-transporting ATPase subunit K
MTKTQKKFKRNLAGFGMLLALLVFIVTGFGAIKAMTLAEAELDTANASVETAAAVDQPKDTQMIKWAFLAAAMAVGIGSIGAGAAVGYVGAAAMGVIGEKPEIAGRALIFVGLAEGIAIYGLIIAIMILGKV